MNPRALLMSGTVQRVLVESATLTTILLLALTAIAGGEQNQEIQQQLSGLRALAVGLIVGPVVALRLRRTEGSVAIQVRYEVLSGLGLLAANLLLSWGVLTVGITLSTGSRVIAGIDPVSLVFSYSLWRVVLLLWPEWNRRRRSRIVWSLSHAQLVTSLVLAFFIAIALTASASRSFESRLPGNDELAGIAQTFVWMTLQLVILTNLFVVLTLVITFVLIPGASLISHFVLRETTRRLTELTTATSSMRAGDLSTRVDVRGEDEVAALQSDFNVMAADLERLMQELESERDTTQRLLTSRRELIASVSHELRTPVATIRGYLDSARRQWGDDIPETLLTDLTVMAREAERLQRLIDDLFTLSRLETDGVQVSREPVDAGSIVHRSVEVAAPLAWDQRRVQVVSDVERNLPFAFADGGRLEQIVRNLVSNAVRHTPAGGLVLASARVDGSSVVVQVKDTGYGIPVDDIPKIWDRFHRGDDSRVADQSGAGLGLALVKELTEAMDGSVDVESAIDQGSTFTVRLPVADHSSIESPRSSIPH